MPATDLRIEQAGPGHAALVARIACAAFGMPAQLEPWIADMMGRINRRHDLTCDGVSLGCRWLVTETGEDLPRRGP